MRYDYIIVGAGSAGCVLASRLSEDPACRVLLLEAGGNNRHLYSAMPSAFSLPMGHRRFDWRFRAEPAQGLAQRALDCPRGLGLGGSSAINGMVYVRGHPGDFERWQALGAEGWGYTSVLPYFRRAENCLASAPDDGYRGHDGPLTVSRGVRQNPLYDAFVASACEAGFAESQDLNGFRQEAFGALEQTIAGGRRMSAARAYLRPAMARSNLSVRTDCTVERLDVDGTRCTGVVLAESGERLKPGKEVLLAAGAIGSPVLLQRSGVGSNKSLREAKVAQRHELPEVGQNLMDHLEVYFQQPCVPEVSLNRWLSPLGKARIGARWLLRQDGLGATNHFEVGGFTCSSDQIPWPDIQYHFLPAAVSYDGSRAASGPGFQVHIGPMQSTSRGSVQLNQSDPMAPPQLDFNYMSDPEDWAVFRAAIRQARDIFEQPSLTRYRRAEAERPLNVDDDAAIDAFVAGHAESAYHPCGTCRMGSDSGAVVDPDCRVRGLSSLRVIDASIFPHITNGNLNAPTIMVAERAADLICGKGLPAAPLPYFGQERVTQAFAGNPKESAHG